MRAAARGSRARRASRACSVSPGSSSIVKNGTPCDLAALQDADDVRVVEGAADLRLAQEALQELRLLQERAQRPLERADLAAALRLVDGGHAAAPQRLEEPVVAEVLDAVRVAPGAGAAHAGRCAARGCDKASNAASAAARGAAREAPQAPGGQREAGPRRRRAERRARRCPSPGLGRRGAGGSPCARRRRARHPRRRRSWPAQGRGGRGGGPAARRVGRGGPTRRR